MSKSIKEVVKLSRRAIINYGNWLTDPSTGAVYVYTNEGKIKWVPCDLCHKGEKQRYIYCVDCMSYLCMYECYDTHKCKKEDE